MSRYTTLSRLRVHSLPRLSTTPELAWAAASGGGARQFVGVDPARSRRVKAENPHAGSGPLNVLTTVPKRWAQGIEHDGKMRTMICDGLSWLGLYSTLVVPKMASP